MTVHAQVSSDVSKSWF